MRRNDHCSERRQFAAAAAAVSRFRRCFSPMRAETSGFPSSPMPPLLRAWQGRDRAGQARCAGGQPRQRQRGAGYCQSSHGGRHLKPESACYGRQRLPCRPRRLLQLHTRHLISTAPWIARSRRRRPPGGMPGRDQAQAGGGPASLKRSAGFRILIAHLCVCGPAVTLVVLRVVPLPAGGGRRLGSRLLHRNPVIPPQRHDQALTQDEAEIHS